MPASSSFFKTIGRGIKNTFKPRLVAPSFNYKKFDRLRLSVAEINRKHLRHLERVGLRKELGLKGPLALKSPEYRKLLGKQIKTYGNELVHDVTNPIETAKKQFGLITHDYNPVTKQLKNRSHFGKAFQAMSYYGIPISLGTSTLTKKNIPAKERVTRALPEYLSMLTPKQLPSWALYNLSDMLYKGVDKKRRQAQLMSKLKHSPYNPPALNYIPSKRNVMAPFNVMDDTPYMWNNNEY